MSVIEAFGAAARTEQHQIEFTSRSEDFVTLIAVVASSWARKALRDMRLGTKSESEKPWNSDHHVIQSTAAAPFRPSPIPWNSMNRSSHVLARRRETEVDLGL
jgi:hypothetical protein